MKLLVFICIATASITQIATAGMVGGWTNVTDVNSTSFQNILSFATDRISASSNALYKMKTMEIINAEKQIVSGVNYRITMRIGATECKKNKNDDINDCKFLRCGAVEKCNVTVWDKPWEENGTKLTKQSCDREPKSC